MTHTELAHQQATEKPCQCQPNPTPDLPEVLIVEEVASLLRVNRNTIYDLVTRKEIPCRRVGKCIRFHREAVLEWLQGNCSALHGNRSEK